MDTDDGNVYDELVIEQNGDGKQVRGYSDYTVRSNNLPLRYCNEQVKF